MDNSDHVQDDEELYRSVRGKLEDKEYSIQIGLSDPVGSVLRRIRPNATCIPNRTGSYFLIFMYPTYRHFYNEETKLTIEFLLPL